MTLFFLSFYAEDADREFRGTWSAGLDERSAGKHGERKAARYVNEQEAGRAIFPHAGKQFEKYPREWCAEGRE